MNQVIYLRVNSPSLRQARVLQRHFMEKMDKHRLNIAFHNMSFFLFPHFAIDLDTKYATVLMKLDYDTKLGGTVSVKEGQDITECG